MTRVSRGLTLVLMSLVATIGLWPGPALPAAFGATAQESDQVEEPEAPAELDGEIIDFAIQPLELTVRSGDTITYTNNGGRPHTVTDRGGLFDTDPILPGESASITPLVPGTYEVFCRINPSTMNARIVVEATPTAPPAVRVQALDENREGAARSFDPATLEVPVGTELVLSNVGGLPHSLRASDDSFNIPVIEPGAEQGRFPGGSASTILANPGEFEFYCELHPDEMRGTVTVVALPESTAAPPIESSDDRAPPDTASAVVTTTTVRPLGDGEIVDFAFSPTELLVEPGEQVVWSNTGSVAHTVTFDTLEIDTGLVAPQDSVTLTAPEQPGTYGYFCSIHPAMRGAMRVSPPTFAAAPSSPLPDTPTDGTLFAYAFAVLVLGTGAAGVGLGLRRH
jgi:plastocyanin